MKEYQASVFHPRRNILGEGILWDNISHRLLWVDINAGLIFEHDMSTNQTEIYETEDYATTVALWDDNKLLVSGKRNLYLFDRETKAKTLFLTVPDIPDNYRLNDGKTDFAGRFFVGTMIMPLSPQGEGKLYRITKDKKIVPVLGGISCSNGICWSQDNKTMYYIDTMTQKISAFDYDAATGNINNRRVAVDTIYYGFPDGMTIDNNSNLWVAFYGGASVLCFDPNTSQVLARVSVPADLVTSCVFAGSILYICAAGGYIYSANIT